MATSQTDDPVSNIAAALLTNAGSGAGVIEIEEREGTVTLKGLVESDAASSSAEMIARQQNGVVSVINELITDNG